MSAEVLREAAALMRERATASPVRPGPWEKEFSDVIRTDVPFGAPGYLIAEVATVPEAEHIASWHPAVALAVADWLRSVAVDVDKRDNPKRVGGRFEAIRIPDEHAALAVARAYLGSDS